MLRRASYARAAVLLLTVAPLLLFPLQAHSSPALLPLSSASHDEQQRARPAPRQWNDIASPEDALILTHMLPRLLDTLFDDAFKRLDDASHGVLSDFTGPDVSFALSPNRTQLTARVLLPTHGRKVQVSLLGRRHLQLRVHTQSESITAMAVHTLLLPVAVSADGVSMRAQQDGSVHVVFKSVNESSASEDAIKAHAMRPVKVQKSAPRGDVVHRCGEKHRSCRIRFDACVCAGMRGEEGGIECTTQVIQRCVQLLRRDGSDAEASGVKHAAMECTDGTLKAGGDVGECVERVMRGCVHAVTRRGTNDSACAVDTGVKTTDWLHGGAGGSALGERDGDGGERFEHYAGGWRVWTVAALMMTTLLAVAALALLAARGVRRACARSNKATSQLSSALVQQAVNWRKQL